jgi:hypothetical protein
MKRSLLAIAALLVIGGCLPFSPVPNPAPSVDVAATAAANVQTSVVQTLTAQPTNTFVPASATLEPTLTAEATLSPMLSPTAVVEAATGVTATFDIVTSTNVIMTAVPAGAASMTPTLGVLTYGTLPPAVPFSNVTLINRSKRQAYISLQVVTAQGGPTIIEYPVRGQIKIQAPTGQYLYVAWVGGREMVGEFRLHKDQDLSIILYKDRVEIN